MFTFIKRKWFVPFRYKLMISYLAFSLLPVMIVGYFAYHASVDSIKQQTANDLQGILTQMSEQITYKLQDTKRLSDQVYKDYNLQATLRRTYEGWSSYEVTNSYLLPTLQSILKMKRSDTIMKVYVVNDSIPEVYGVQDPGTNPLKYDSRFDLLHMSRLQQEPWYRSLPFTSEQSGRDYLWMQTDDDLRFGNVSLLQKWKDFDSMRQIGFIRTIVRISDLLDSADYHTVGPKSLLYVYDQKGRIIKASGNASSLNHNDYLQIERSLPELNWKLVALVPNSLLEQRAVKVKQITLYVCLGSAGLLLVAGYFIARFFSRRVNKVVRSLNAVREGDFLHRIDFAGKDEFAQIAKAFNRMGQYINRLIEEVYLANLLKKEAELESLQAQINPHFLYNTLSSISRLAKFGEIDKLHEMVMGLAKFYRLTLNSGKTFIRITEELEQVKTYMEIQKIKYRERVDVWFDISPSVYGLETIKLILQPFVENVFLHAWYGGRVHIRVTAYKENGAVVFKIIDNGVGISPHLLEQILDNRGVGVGYGIRNVNDRIKLHHGEQYGVTIHSRLGIGTTIRIIVPETK